MTFYERLAYPFMFLMVVQGVLLAVGHAVYLLPYVQLGIPGTTYFADFVRYVVTAATYVLFGIACAFLKWRQAKRRKGRHEQARVMSSL